MPRATAARDFALREDPQRKKGSLRIASGRRRDDRLGAFETVTAERCFERWKQANRAAPMMRDQCPASYPKLVEMAGLHFDFFGAIKRNDCAFFAA
jgi:hypothetical protein